MLSSQNIIDKIASKSYLVKDIAKNLAYDIFVPEEYAQKEKYIYIGNCLSEANKKLCHNVIVAENIYPNNYLDEDQVLYLPKEYEPAMKLQKVRKLVFPVHNYQLEAHFDNEKRVLLADTIWLEFYKYFDTDFYSDFQIDYNFAMLWFNLPITHFIFKHSRQNHLQIAINDIANLPFPKITPTQCLDFQKLIKQIKLAYKVLWEEINYFWDKFNEYFFNTRTIGKPVEDNFYQYSWQYFWKVISEIRKNNGMENYEPSAKGKKALYNHFYQQQFKVQAIRKELQLFENQANSLIYTFYNLSEEEIAQIENS
jgi:hypothetical protein